MAFDPCREWLGIDAVALGDPARVLGVPAECRDPAVIGRAADARLQSLRQVTPGPFAKAHAALVSRVEEARDTLLAAAFSGAASAQATDSRPSFAPSRAAGSSSAPGWVGADEVPAGSSGRFSNVANDDQPLVGPALGSPVRRTIPRSNSSSGAGGLLLASFALLAAAVAVLLFLMLRPDRQVAVKKPPSTPTSPGTSDRDHSKGDQQPPQRPPSPPKQPEMASPTTPPTTGGSTAPDAGGGDPGRADPEAERRRREADLQKQEAERRRREQEEQARVEADMAEQKAAAAARAAEEKRRQEDMAAKEATQQADQERGRMREALDKSLGDAYAAMRRDEFDTVDRAIAAAGNQVGDDVESATRIERWRLLATYAREFTKFRDQAIAAANAGREFQLGGKPFSVIEITPDMFIYKMAGKIERVPRDRIDPRIEMAVVEGWFEGDGRAANHLFLGARWLCLDPPDPARARAEWRKAGDGGEQVEPLTALLDDPVIRRAGR